MGEAQCLAHFHVLAGHHRVFHALLPIFFSPRLITRVPLIGTCPIFTVAFSFRVP